MSPRERTDMHSIREILRLSRDLHLSSNEIHRTLQISRDVVQKCIKAAKEKAIEWPLPADLDDRSLEELLFSGRELIKQGFVEPDCEYIHNELKKRGVTRQLLWKEYVGDSPAGKYSYSQFKRKYQNWVKRNELSMRQEHKAGEKLFLDYAGQTIPVVIDRVNGEARFAQIFVAVLGASNYCYCEASWSQDMSSWTGAHVRMFQFLKGVPECLIPDNLKSAVTQAEKFDPLINRTYQRLARHYGCAIRSARSYHPKDKAKVEKGVQVVESWILARLRNYTFFSLQHLNETIHDLLIELNNEPFQKISGTRFSLYQSIDFPALHPLPKTPFEMEDWLTGIKVDKSYHVTVERHHYSVPHQLRGEHVDVRYTDTIVEILHNNIRVTSHPRNPIENGHSTLDEHRPPQHALYAGLSAEKFLLQADEIGPFTHKVIATVIDAHPYPQLAFDKCFGILNSLLRKYGDSKLESAAEYAIRIGTPTYRMIKAVLEADELPQQLSTSTIDSHENIRGPQEFAQ